MTFVAHPYEQFTDDLLTALTGGVSREEHKFMGSEQPYTLAIANAVASSLKVFGQSNDVFTVFSPATDFTYKEGAIHWNKDGIQPDDSTYFYINYYVEGDRGRLTDRNPGSVTTTLAEAFAREFAVLHKQMELIYRSAFLELANGTSLDYIAALLGLTRRDARFAQGEALFQRSTPAPGDISIPAGTLVSTDEGQNFETNAERTLRRGQLSIAAPLRAQVDGKGGLVAAGAINNVNRPIFGIETVANAQATFFASEKENDGQFRARIPATLERAGKSTLNSIKYSLIEEIPGVDERNVQVVENSELPGRVEVRFGLQTTPDLTLVRRIEETIFSARPAGIRVSHNLPTRVLPASAGATGPDGGILPRGEVMGHFAAARDPERLVHFSDEVLRAMREGVLELQVEVLLQSTRNNLAASEKDLLEDQVRRLIQQYFEELPMGADVIYYKLAGRVVALEEVADADLLIRPARSEAGKDATAYRANVYTAGRKPAAQLVYVGWMDEPIALDVTVKLEPTPGAPASITISQDLNVAARESFQTFLAGARTQLAASQVRDFLGTTLAKVQNTLQLADGRPIVLNAEFEETGRLLNDFDTLNLEENQVLELRKFDLQIKGAMNA